MRDLQDRADELIRQDPAVAATFTMTGNNAFLSSNQGLLLAFLKSPEDRAPIQEVAGGLMGKLSAIPGVMPFMRAASGARDQHRRDKSKPGTIRFHLVGGESNSRCTTCRYEANGKTEAVPGVSPPLLRLLQQHAQSRHRDPARPGQNVWCIGDAHTHLAQKRLLAELSLPDQEA